MSKEEASPSSRVRLFGGSHCEEVIYRIKIAHDKFDYSAFTKSIGQRPDPSDWGDVVCPSKNSDYHAHIAWTDEKKQVRIQLGHYADEPEPSLIPKNVIYAEECVKYVGQFFKNESAQAHIHADFNFGATKQSRFPLPLRTTIGACKSEIDAIGFKLSEAPSGVSKIWLMQYRDELAVQLFADKRLVFGSFSVADDIKDFVSVIDGVTEVKI